MYGFTFGFIMGGSIAVAMALKAREYEPSYRLPSIVQAQRILIDEGFDIKADGILGKETQRAWEAYDTGLKQWWGDTDE